MAHNSEAQSLSLVAFSVMLADKRHEALRKADKPDSECAVVDYRRDFVFRREGFTSRPKFAHKQRELLGKSRLLEIEAVVQLAGGNLKHIIKTAEESGDALFLVLCVHTLDGKAHDVDCRETEIAAPD